MKRLLTFLIVTLTITLLATTVRVLLWDDALTQALRQGIPEFEKTTGIKVELELVPSGTLLQKTLISVTAKSADYDLIAVDEPNIPLLAPILLPLAYWPETKFYTRPSMADIMPLALAAGQWRGQFMGLPVNSNVYIWLTRKDIIEQYKEEFKKEYGYEMRVPQTLQELLDMSKFLAKKGIYGWAPFTKPTEGATCEAIWMFESFGTSVLEVTPDGYKVVLDKSKAVEAINFYKELLKYAPPGALDYGHAERVAAFARGEVFSMFNWPALVPDIENPEKSLVAGRIAYTAPPAGPAKRAAIRGCWIVAIPLAAKEKAAAAEFAYWWMSLETGRKLIPFGLTPARESLLRDPQYVVERPWFEGIYLSMNYAVERPRFEKYPEVSQIIRTHWLDAISGKISPEVAVDRMVNDINALLKKYGY
ncbi:extracellular solute-binding protein [Pseudothermotoga thermarum]|uniref:Extracellular solute-binding protein family 1 n=1 Tax=Pseudothermotoga thermarum DSM 5069 TaxID=688269 RepID=F7YVY2_9THEM|nr:extracellular solute-binding protein [Pseudothermotoga thermarum]AEH51811.1 extracellular solute-binding protein family 1 [Pseudothermotoga thermarum DSM 5069]